MIYIICPTCGELLGNKEEKYFEGVKKICNEFGIDDDITSLETMDGNTDFCSKMENLLDGLVNKEATCCASRLPNIVDLCKLIK